jgi:hypothetical protein
MAIANPVPVKGDLAIDDPACARVCVCGRLSKSVDSAFAAFMSAAAMNTRAAVGPHLVYWQRVPTGCGFGRPGSPSMQGMALRYS